MTQGWVQCITHLVQTCSSLVSFILHTYFLSLIIKAIGLLVDNKASSTRSDLSDVDSFVKYSKTHATHCVHELDCYQMPSPIKEISVSNCHRKGEYNSVVFASLLFPVICVCRSDWCS